MNGGPGSTSMNSVFMEAGPLRCIWNDPQDLDSFVVTYRPELSWQTLGDLLFVDHPVGTGWSYGEHSPESLPEVAADFVTFLNNFYDEYPERRVQELVLTGESFAGKYLSFTGQAIIDYNTQVDESLKINFKRLVLSNPLVDVETERMYQHELGFSLGLYDES
jgi:carboxypeptidase D